MKAALVALPGIGEWTADWFLARHLGASRRLARRRSGLRKAVLRFYGEEDDAAPPASAFPGTATWRRTTSSRAIGFR